MNLNKNPNLNDDEAQALLSLLQFFVSSDEMKNIYPYYKSNKKTIASLYKKFTGKTVESYLEAVEQYDDEK